VFDPFTFAAYSRDPRYVALKAEAYLKSTGIADTAYFAPEAEFFIFDGVRYSSNNNEASYSIESEESLVEQQPFGSTGVWWPNSSRNAVTSPCLLQTPYRHYDPSSCLPWKR